ncbi:MAG: DUF2188 domain-containing protein [Chloroflexota bacterium]|nr:DUF2188 domain-containing protein [Chloroflexota bacterium]
MTHVVPARRGWDVEKERQKTPVKHFATKPPAIEKAKAISKDAELGQIRIHGKDGKIQTEYTYGQDPNPPKG